MIRQQRGTSALPYQPLPTAVDGKDGRRGHQLVAGNKSAVFPIMATISNS